MNTIKTILVLVAIVALNVSGTASTSTQNSNNLNSDDMANIIQILSGKKEPVQKPLSHSWHTSRACDERWSETTLDTDKLRVFICYFPDRISVYWRARNAKDSMLTSATVNHFGEILNASDPDCKKMFADEDHPVDSIRPELKEFWQAEANKVLRLTLAYLQSPH